MLEYIRFYPVHDKKAVRLAFILILLELLHTTVSAATRDPWWILSYFLHLAAAAAMAYRIYLDNFQHGPLGLHSSAPRVEWDGHTARFTINPREQNYRPLASLAYWLTLFLCWFLGDYLGFGSLGLALMYSLVPLVGGLVAVLVTARFTRTRKEVSIGVDSITVINTKDTRTTRTEYSDGRFYIERSGVHEPGYKANITAKGDVYRQVHPKDSRWNYRPERTWITVAFPRFANLNRSDFVDALEAMGRRPEALAEFMERNVL